MYAYVKFSHFINVQHAQRDLARNHSGPTSVKSRKCRRNLKKSGVYTAKCPRKIEHGDLL